MKETENIQFIIVNGYTSTGSSAVLDLLKEYDDMYVPDREFRLIKDPDGIIDLDRALNKPIDLLNEDLAIKRFLKFSKKYSRKGNGFRKCGLGYCDIFGKDFYSICRQYIEDLISYDYQGHWWYFDLEKSWLKMVLQKVLAKLKIYDYRRRYRMCLVNQNEERFLTITRNFLNNIFESLLREKRIDAKYIVLDQGVPGSFPFYAQRYFWESKVIVVERDPRDVYIDLITEKDMVGHVGHDVRKTHNIGLFVEWYKKNRHYGNQVGEQLKVQFEDLILHYDDEVSKIEDYLGLNKDMHKSVKKYLKPELSKKNVGYWRKYPYQDEIKEIEIELKDYLYKGDYNNE